MKKKFLYKLFIIIILFNTGSACKKDKDKNNSTETYVDFYIDLNSAQFTGINHIGGWCYVTGGKNGILIYRISDSEFNAYSRTCTLKSDSCQRIEVDKSALYAQDSSCKSKFLILDGSPDPNSAAKTALYRYHTAYDGRFLRVYN